MSDKDFLGHRLMERRLEDELPREAELFEAHGGRELHLEEVLARAGGIRRKRRSVRGLVAAAVVVAVLAPAGVILAHRESASGPGPLVQPTTSTSTSPSPAPTVDPNTVHAIGFAALAGKPAGQPPATGYVDDDVWHAPDGSTTDQSFTRYGMLDAAPIGDDLLIRTGAEQTGDPTAILVHTGDRNTVAHSWPISGGFVTSPGGAVVAFAEPDGTPVVVQDGGSQWYEMPKVPAGAVVAAVRGADCKEQSPGGGGCTVFLNSLGNRPKTWMSSSHGLVDAASAHIRNLADVSTSGRVAGISEHHTDLTTCSEVRGTDDQLVWRTCDNRFESFSPDGSRLLATNGIGDGLGDNQLDVFDARSGDPVVRYRVADGGAITWMRWEDDAHVLAVVFDEGVWGIVRVGLDGQVEVAVPPVKAKGADPTNSPFLLPQ